MSATQGAGAMGVAVTDHGAIEPVYDEQGRCVVCALVDERDQALAAVDGLMDEIKRLRGTRGDQ